MLKTNCSRYILFPKLGTVINAEVLEDFNLLKKSVKADFDSFNLIPNKKGISSALANCSQLIFEVTQNCTLSCKYCVYSGKYSQNRVHNNLSMNIEVAKKAINIFFKLINSKLRKSNLKRITISFYGGEPTLEMDLIAKIVDQIEVEKRNLPDVLFIYRITTNGTLLNSNKIKYFIEHNFHIDISIDGPQCEHDLFRVFKNGKGSWNTVMRGINRIKNQNSDYYQNNVSFLCTMHPLHNGKRVDLFFRNNSLLFADKVNINLIDLDNIDDQYRKKYLETKSIKSKLYEKKVFGELSAKLGTKYLNSHTMFTGTCFPGGTKLFVDPNGDFKICEKVNNLSPIIGDVFTGIDYNVIKKIVISYNTEIVRHKCWECDCWFLCTICFRSCFAKGKIDFNCMREVTAIKKMLVYYLEHLETVAAKNLNNISELNDYSDFMDSLM